MRNNLSIPFVSYLQFILNSPLDCSSQIESIVFFQLFGGFIFYHHLNGNYSDSQQLFIFRHFTSIKETGMFCPGHCPNNIDIIIQSFTGIRQLGLRYSIQLFI